MTEQINSLKTALQRKRADLYSLVQSQSSQLTIGDGESELIDRMQAMSRREEAITFLDTLNRTLADVNAALVAMEEGSYGACVECDEPIAIKRLQAVPWASRCIHCQQMLDQSKRMRVLAPNWDEAA